MALMRPINRMHKINIAGERKKEKVTDNFLLAQLAKPMKQVSLKIRVGKNL